MKGRAKREAGGKNDAEEDVKTKPMHYTADSNVNREAEERKSGGRTKKHEKECRCHKCMGGSARKEGGKVEGEREKMRADRKPRQSGGRANATESPFSSARRGTEPEGHKTEVMD